MAANAANADLITYLFLNLFQRLIPSRQSYIFSIASVGCCSNAVNPFPFVRQRKPAEFVQL